MIKFLRYIVCLLLCAAVLLPLAPVQTAEAYVYSDGYTTVGNVTMPLPEYMPGTYFSKDGGPCSCHDNSAINCVASGVNCNCLRFVNIDGKDVDLLAVQCIGFARYCFYKLFGFVDHDYNTHLYYNAGSVAGGYVTAASVKALVQQLKPGAHIRVQLAYTQHSVIVLKQDENGFTVYHANAGGNGIESSACVVSTRTFTWEQFAVFAYRGIVFAHMPNNYPENLTYSDTPPYSDLPTPTPETAEGLYITTANLNLRVGAGTEHGSLGIVPSGTEFTVMKIENNWGLVNYNGNEGWISLAYARIIRHLVLRSASKLRIDEGFLLGVQSGSISKDITAEFVNANAACEAGEESAVATGINFGIMTEEGFVEELTAVVSGDTNGDGQLTSADYLLVKTHLNGSLLLENEFLMAADFNNDGIINTTDYKKMRYTISQ